MTTLAWDDSYDLQQPQMDATHREFVELLGRVEHALDHAPESLAERYRAFLAHTVEHFAQEERWMAKIGFAVENCHAVQHRHVLDVLHEVQTVIGVTGDAQILRRLVTELSAWFAHHATMMDAALAETMRAVGFDPSTGHVAGALPGGGPITGCGSSSCS